MVDSSDNYYERWSDADLVERFSKKQPEDFFRTETWALSKTGGDFSTVLDIGCASGRMIELLAKYTDNKVSYTGIDIAEENIIKGRELYPDSNFILTNGIDYNPGNHFSLINATGVCQHEPKFEELIKHMIDLSDKFVMFDVKFTMLDHHLVDSEISYCQFNSHRLYYVLLAIKPFLTFLKSLHGVEEISIYGYETTPSANSSVPDVVDTLISAGVFLVKGEGDQRLSLEFPGQLQAKFST